MSRQVPGSERNQTAPLEPPPDAADADVFAEALQKTVVRAMMDPGSYAQLLDGLRSADPKERRQWWSLCFQYGLGRGAKGEELAGGGTKIVFHSTVPEPGRPAGVTVGVSVPPRLPMHDRHGNEIDDG